MCFYMSYVFISYERGALQSAKLSLPGEVSRESFRSAESSSFEAEEVQPWSSEAEAEAEDCRAMKK